MHTNSEIRQWGNGLAVRLNKTIIEAANLSKGSKIEIRVDEEGIHIRPAKEETKRLTLPFSEKDLIADLGPAEHHSELLTSPTPKELGDSDPQEEA